MESLLLTTTASNLLTGRNSSVSSLSSSSSLGSIPSGKVEVRRSRIGKVKTPTSIVASVSKRGTGKGSSANVAVDGSVAAVAAVEDVPTASWKDVQYPAGSIGHRQPKPTEVDKEKQMEYITKILGSTVYDVAVETPLQLAPLLSQQLGVNLWLKREDSQQVFSFKIRGAYNMISQLPEDQRKRGVICASAGNHAQGVALSGKRLKIISNIVMPKTTPQIKIDAVKRLGGLVETYGDSFDEAQARAKQRAVDENLTFIPPFDDEDVIAGQGTVGMEIGRQIRGDIHAIFVPVGGGGLIAGIASFFKLVYPGVKVFGVEPNDQNSMAQALKLGHIVNVTDIGHFADGVAVQQVGNETFRISNELVDDIILVDKYAISKAVQDMFNDGRNILEPSGALSIAAAKAYCEYNNIKGVNVVAVTSGANMNFSQLRVISDIANNDTQTILVSILPEQPGSLDKLSTLIHDLGFNLLETSYRFGEGSTDAVVVYKVDAVGSDLQNLLLELNSVGFETYALNDNDAAASHLRHMTGGRAKVENEALFRFTFPERKGALKHFLHGFQPNWNISLFHHRAEGILKSSVLVGIQLEKSEEKNFHAYAKKVGYKYEVLSPDDAAYILTSKP